MDLKKKLALLLETMKKQNATKLLLGTSTESAPLGPVVMQFNTKKQTVTLHSKKKTAKGKPEFAW